MTFPVDDVTLGMLEAACIGDDEGSHLMDMLGFGSVDTGTYVHYDQETGDRMEFRTRAGGYHPNDVILALIGEVRSLRGASLPVDNGTRKWRPWSRKNGRSEP